MVRIENLRDSGGTSGFVLGAEFSNRLPILTSALCSTDTIILGHR